MSLILVISLIFFCVAFWSGYNLYRVSRYTEEEIEEILRKDKEYDDWIE